MSEARRRRGPKVEEEPSAAKRDTLPSRQSLYRWQRASPVPDWLVRMAVRHFANLAICYEHREKRPLRRSDIELVEDITNRLSDNLLGPTILASQLCALAKDFKVLRAVYANYSRGRLQQDALLHQVKEFFRTCDVELNEGQEKLLTPSRNDLSNLHGGPSKFAEEMLGLILYGVNGKTIHNWLRMVVRLPVPAGSGIPDEQTRRYFNEDVLATTPQSPSGQPRSAEKIAGQLIEDLVTAGQTGRKLGVRPF
jgi:hypothetical protein